MSHQLNWHYFFLTLHLFFCSLFTNSQQAVFWDINECPFPYALDPETIFERIKLALKDRRVTDGVMSIWAYAEKIPFSDEILDTFKKSRIYFVPQVPGDKTARVIRMVHDTELWEVDSPLDYRQQSNVIVISNDISSQGDLDFTTCLQFMDARGYYAFLVQPMDIAQEKLTAPDWPRGILDNAVDFSITALSNKKWKKKVKKHKEAAEKPQVSPVKTLNTQDSSPVETMKNQDCSKPIRPVSGPRIGVFWDVHDFPIPEDLHPDMLYQIIESALEEKGYYGVMSIWAYAEKIPFSDDVLDKYLGAEIYFVPKVPGNKTARAHRMIHDMFLWEMDTPLNYRTPPSVIVISNDIPGEINFSYCLSCLYARIINAFLVEPKKLVLDDLGSSFRPECLLDVGEIVCKYLCFPSSSNEQKRRKKL